MNVAARLLWWTVALVGGLCIVTLIALDRHGQSERVLKTQEAEAMVDSITARVDLVGKRLEVRIEGVESRLDSILARKGR